jgi:hypothetical protein
VPITRNAAEEKGNGMKSVSKLEKELSKATGITPKKGEEREAFLLRLAQAVDKKLDQKKYAKLTSPAQDWFERAVGAANHGEDMPELELAPKGKKGLKIHSKKKDEPKLPGTWKEIQKLDESEIEEIAEAADVDLDGDYETLDAVHKALADALKIKRPVSFKGKAKQKEENEEEDVPTWKQIQKMDDNDLEELVTLHKLKLKRGGYDSIKEVREHVAEQLGVEIPKILRPQAKPTGTVVKAKKKAAEKGNGQDGRAAAAKERAKKQQFQTFSRSIGKLLPAKYRDAAKNAMAKAIRLEVE